MGTAIAQHVVASTARPRAGVVTPPSFVRRALSEPSRPIGDSPRAELERRFGHDFASVRIHDGPVAGASARAVGALAYTLGEHICLSSGAPPVHTSEGRALLAHELAHVVQQRRGGGTPGGVSEQEADRAAAQIGGTRPVAIETGSAVGIARAPEDWLRGSLNVADWSLHELMVERDLLTEWLQDHDIASSPDQDTIRDAIRQLDEAIRSKSPSAAQPKRRPGRPGGRKPQELGPAPPRPKVLQTGTSVQYSDDADMLEQFDLIATWLQRDDLKREDRAVLRREYEALGPAVATYRRGLAAARGQAKFAAAITAPVPGGADADLAEQMSRIDRIGPMPGEPGVQGLPYGNGVLRITDQQVARIRLAAQAALDSAVAEAHEMNEETLQQADDWLEHNLEHNAWVGAYVSYWSGETARELKDKVLRVVANSNSTLIATYGKLRDDPKVPLTQKARVAEAGITLAETARRQLDEGTDRAISTAGHIVTALEITKKAAFTVDSILIAGPLAAEFGEAATALEITGGAARVAAVGTATSVGVGTANFVVQGGSAGAGTLLAGGSLSEAKTATLEQGTQAFKETAPIGLPIGIVGEAANVFRTGAALSRVGGFARSVSLAGGANVAGYLESSLLEWRAPTLSEGGLQFVSGAGGAAFGELTSLVPSTAVRQSLQFAGGTAIGGLTAYAGGSDKADIVTSGLLGGGLSVHSAELNPRTGDPATGSPGEVKPAEITSGQEPAPGESAITAGQEPAHGAGPITAGQEPAHGAGPITAGQEPAHGEGAGPGQIPQPPEPDVSLPVQNKRLIVDARAAEVTTRTAALSEQTLRLATAKQAAGEASAEYERAKAASDEATADVARSKERGDAPADVKARQNEAKLAASALRKATRAVANANDELAKARNAETTAAAQLVNARDNLDRAQKGLQKTTARESSGSAADRRLDSENRLFTKIGELNRSADSAILDTAPEPDQWLDEYQAGNPDHDLVTTSDVGFRYGFDVAKNRLVTISGSPGRVLGPRDLAAIKGRLGEHPMPYENTDRGHGAAHSLGGGLDINVFPQKDVLNEGHSDAGKVWRAIETHLEYNPAPFEIRFRYSDATDYPSHIEFGFELSDGRWAIHQFDNR